MPSDGVTSEGASVLDFVQPGVPSSIGMDDLVACVGALHGFLDTPQPPSPAFVGHWNPRAFSYSTE